MKNNYNDQNVNNCYFTNFKNINVRLGYSSLKLTKNILNDVIQRNQIFRLTLVHLQMPDQMCLLREPLVAMLTHEGFLTRVHQHVLM